MIVKLRGFGLAAALSLLLASAGSAGTGPNPASEREPLPTDGAEIGAPSLEEPAAYIDVTISRSLADLPPPVRRTRERLIEAARTGDLEALRPIIAGQSGPPVLTFGDAEEPIGYLRQVSNDGQGRETLAILLELLEAPFGILDKGGEAETYIWPYLAAVDLEKLNPEEFVDLFKIVSFSDYEDMVAQGGWYFYRVTIDPNGDWTAFVAGD